MLSACYRCGGSVISNYGEAKCIACGWEAWVGTARGGEELEERLVEERGKPRYRWRGEGKLNQPGHYKKKAKGGASHDGEA